AASDAEQVGSDCNVAARGRSVCLGCDYAVVFNFQPVGLDEYVPTLSFEKCISTDESTTRPVPVEAHKGSGKTNIAAIACPAAGCLNSGTVFKQERIRIHNNVA